MKQKTRIASKLFAALVVLTLISCCFLGTTFARYTSNNSGVANVSVAKWEIAFTDNNGLTWDDDVDFGKLSPNMTGWTQGMSSTELTNSTGKIALGAIENKSEVDAQLTVTFADTPTYAGATFDGTGYYYGSDETANTVQGDGASEAQVDALFSIEVWYTSTPTPADASDYASYTSGKELTLKAAGKAGEGETSIVYFWAEVTWTTDYGASGITADEWNKGALQDAIDTWVGENITNVKWGLSYTAVQASELPSKPSTP